MTGLAKIEIEDEDLMLAQLPSADDVVFAQNY